MADDLRLFTVFEALKEGVSPEEINAVTKIDLFFIHKLKNLADYEALLAKSDLTDELYLRGKKLGYHRREHRRPLGAENPQPPPAVL